MRGTVAPPGTPSIAPPSRLIAPSNSSAKQGVALSLVPLLSGRRCHNLWRSATVIRNLLALWTRLQQAK
jgi:hypothetical protein